MTDREKPTTIWMPDGVTRGGTQLERVELRPGVMAWFRQFSDVATVLDLGIHCARCGKDVGGRNSDTATIFSVACACREFIGPNRDWRGDVRPS